MTVAAHPPVRQDRRVEVFDERVCRLGEGPHYDERTNRVVWVDILGEKLLWRSLDPRAAAGAGQVAQGELPVDGHVGAAVPRRNGGLVLCLPDGPVLLEPDGTLRLLGTYAQADAAAGRPRAADAPRTRSNDAKADPYGRLWLGTLAYDETPRAAALYRLDPGAAAPVRVVDDVTISNGLGWSPDGLTMYYIDTPTRRVDTFAYDPDTGALGERRTFVEADPDWGFPDGMCVDAAGGVWVAFYGGGAVRRFTPDGRLDRVARVGTSNVTSCGFAGEQLDLLVVTTGRGDAPEAGPGAGMTYAHRPGDVGGRTVDRFAG
jgi:sugar lactone lactonase YvrE